MKKFQFAMGALALGLLASCSSDAPELPNNQPVDEPTGKTYVAMRITTPGMTRVEGDEVKTKVGEDYENTIDDIAMYVVDKDGKTVVSLSTDNIKEGVAYFAVDKITYDILAPYKDAPVTLKVYANIASKNYSLKGTYTAKSKLAADPWGTAPTADAEQDDFFVMTNNTQTLAKLSTKNFSGANTDPENAWVLNGIVDGDTETRQVTVVLDRLTSRFDMVAPSVKATKAGAPGYDATAKNYRADEDTNLILTIEGASVNTHETECYFFKQATGADWATPGSSTTSFTNELLKKHNYDLTLTNHVYARPHVIPEVYSTPLSYRNCSYVAVKASFTHAELLPTTAADGAKAYAYNGVLLGTFDQFKTKEASYYPERARAGIGTILAGVKNGSITEAKLAEYDKVEVYTKTGGKWYTYYNRIITNDGLLPVTKDNADIIRNTIYELSVKSFRGMGTNGDKTPHDPDNTVQSLYMDLEINVANWIHNQTNHNWAL